jgi:23S rRNA (cytosine1962-C5)-methyltransferase
VSRRATLRIQLDKSTARAVAAGHPWVFRDVLEGLPRRPRSGEEVVLLDSVGAFLAKGLAGDDEGRGPGIRIFSRNEREAPVGKLLFARIGAARRLRERIVPAGTDAFRLLHGEGDGLPGLVVDRYGPVLVIRPDDLAMWTPLLDRVVEALRSEGPRGVRAIVLRTKAGDREVLWGDESLDEVIVSEEGRRYLVRPGHGQKTGFFCDQRVNRTHLQGLVRSGDRTLNLFSYTGGFSVAMAVAGAAHITSVDVSASILQDLGRNLRLNGADPQHHAQVCADAFSWVRGAPDLGGRVDVAVCDPPALARSKRDLEAAGRAYKSLHVGLAGLIKKGGGLLITCSCTSRFTEADLMAAAVYGLQQGGRRVTRVLRRAEAGPDHPVPPGFPEGRYLSCLTLALD